MHVYFWKYIHYPTANFQREICAALEDFDLRLLEVLAFRGSSKSTLITLIFPIWAIISEWHARYAILIGDTFPQARQCLYNLRAELESNELLNLDWGPFKPESDENDEWQKTSIVIPKYGARIGAHSSGQKIRGLRHLDCRPEIVIGDDLESLESVRSKEQRDKLYNWVKSELWNVGDRRTRFVFPGNLLHSQSFMARLKAEIGSGQLAGRVIEVPIADTRGDPTWPGKFADQEALANERRRIGSDRAWQREMMLKIVPEEGQVVKEDWIVKVQAPHPDFFPGAHGVGVDLAISKKSTADFTAMVPGVAGMLHGKRKVYVGPHPLNERLSMFEMIARAKMMQEAEMGRQFFIESVAYQAAAIEAAKREWLNVVAVSPGGQDKRARLEVIAGYVQDGTVEFLPGCEDMLVQLLGLGVEEHDDLVDAFVYLIFGLLKSSLTGSEVIWV